METPLRVCIGYDPRQAITYNVLQHSIVIRSKQPVSITPLIIEQLPIKRMGLTPFTWTRFLVPWLFDYKGWALFLDADMLCRGDVSEVFELADDKYAVMAVCGKHKFEWASMMLFNCAHPDNQVLTPEFVEGAKGLHTLNWTKNVGNLPDVWNHIVLYDDPKDAKLVHFTGGVPVHKETMGCEYTKEYHEETRFCMSTQPWEVLMGPSVHVDRVMNAKKAQEPAEERPERFA